MYIRQYAVALAALWSHVVCADEQIVLADGVEADMKVLNVAIIGAGAAGSSSAYHLFKYASEAGIPVNITIFERNDYIGGRSTTTYAYDDPRYPVEVGASIFVEVNQILVNAVKRFNLSTSAFKASKSEIPGAALAIWDGEKLVLTMKNEGSWLDRAKLLWKYGFAPIRTIRLMKATVAKFLNMYDAPVFPFTSLTQAVYDVDLLNATASTGEQYMFENGITGAFGHDIVQASTRVNYAQNLNRIHGLEAMVCMATDGAMAVQGGNWQIFELMLQSASATRVLGTAVKEIKKDPHGHYALSFSSSSQHSNVEEAETVTTQNFDTVILAAPLQFSNLSFSPALSHAPDRIPYVRLHVTLFTSPYLLSSAFFGLAPGEAAPKVILTTTRSSPNDSDEDATEFFSISLLQSVTNPKTGDREYLYKIFSPAPVTWPWLTRLLGRNGSSGSQPSMISWFALKIWDSYPHEFPRVTFEDIRFPWADGEHDEFFGEAKRGMPWFYTSGIESFISTMETSALMGKNVAALVVESAKARMSANRMRILA